MGKIRIGFVYPSSYYLFDPFKGDPHTHFQILTVLESHFGESVDLHLFDLRAVDRKFAAYHIDECDIYLHSVYTLDYLEQMDILAALRERFPAAVHIAGGPHATIFQEECAKKFDSLVLGDGEESVIHAVEDYRAGSLQSVYCQERPVDINRYPYPLRKYLPATAIARKGLMTLKHRQGFDQLLSTTVVFSRGCPYNCVFCAMPAVKKYAPGIRYRRPDLIVQEIEYLKKNYRMQGISLLDEIGIPIKREDAIAHLEAIGGTGIVWRGQCRVDGITPEIAKLTAQSGCVTMCFGVESASQRALDLIDKRINLDKTRESIRLMKENGIETRLYMILGLPGEPDNVVDLTWSFIQETSPDIVYLSLLTARPGTILFENPDKFGITDLNTDWTKTMHMYSRYGDERPHMTFRYKEQTPWGAGRPEDRIIADYLELQNRLKDRGIAHL